MGVLDSKTLNCDDLEFFLRRYIQLKKYTERSPEIFEHFKLCVEDGVRFRFMCLNAKVAFLPFLKERQMCTILMSGTLRPFSLIEAKLGIEFDCKIAAEPNLQKWRKQLIVTKLPSIFDYSAQSKVRYTFEFRNNALFHRNCIRFISDLSKTTREGVLVFVPSYSVLKIFQKTILSNPKLKENLQRVKRIFFEKKGEATGPFMSAFKVKHSFGFGGARKDTNRIS